MKRLVLLLLAVAPLSANAQLAVIDPANIAENIRQLVQLELAYARQLEELARAAEQVEAITGNYGIGDLLNGDLYRAARRYTPTTWRDTLRILEAGGLPGSVADVRAIYAERADSLAIIGADEYNQLNPEAPNAQAFERRRNTNLAAAAVAEASYDNTQARLVNYETFMGQIEATENAKSIADLQARIAAENGTSLADLIRLQSVQLQQAGAIEAQQLVDETNMKRQTLYADFPFGELPIE
ncbi:MAG: hypothetical protein DRR42_01695 [Gammaproteobacteria bacterium]|nr:MAG: hypothetical protein DRR42_01695 [Gammaproteobacteria bacterium]